MTGEVGAEDEPPKTAQCCSVVLVEPTKHMQTLMRSMFSGIGMRSLRVFADSDQAAQEILSDPPSAIVIDWNCQPFDGAQFLTLLRHQRMYPVCLVPIIVVMREAWETAVEKALTLGANAVLVKPISPDILRGHLNWALRQSQSMELVGERYQVAHVREQLEADQERRRRMRAARKFQAEQIAVMSEIQSDVDRILNSSIY
ncbi:MAG: response regulator [Alphaproteobacteria bacterium]|nr:response regulator [Alphaproteobacteria bacterium]